MRVVGASLAALAVPGVSPRIARAGLATPRRRGLDQATCPDGSECGPGEMCCGEPNARGAYNCRRPSQVCCCGNAICNPPKQRCWCPSLKAGGVCAHNCPLVYGRGWKDCGPTCCQPHERCVDEAKGLCKSCEDEGMQTCRSYDSKSSVRCCPETRGSYSPCCANMTTTACCGEKQTCEATGRRARCVCPKGTKCGPDCCKRGDEKCCDDAHCCAKSDICCDGDCCDTNRQFCYVTEKFSACAPKSKCKAPDVRCGRYCCSHPEKKCRTRQGRKVCV